MLYFIDDDRLLFLVGRRAALQVRPGTAHTHTHTHTHDANVLLRSIDRDRQTDAHVSYALRAMMIKILLHAVAVVLVAGPLFARGQGFIPGNNNNKASEPSAGGGGESKPMATGQCSFQTPQGLHHDFSHLRKTGGEDYTKIIQVGPNIQFIYQMNLCANTLVNCQNEPAPATEALKIPAGETCRVLGRLAGAKWKVTDSPKSDKNPWGKNLELTYVNGDMCDPAKATSRSVTLRLECDLTAKDPSKFFRRSKEGGNVQYSVCVSIGGGVSLRGKISHDASVELPFDNFCPVLHSRRCHTKVLHEQTMGS